MDAERKGQLDMSWRKVLEGPYRMPWAMEGLGGRGRRE